MKDRDLENRLRNMLRERAEDITDAPDGLTRLGGSQAPGTGHVDDLANPRRRLRRSRWLPAVIAAAIVVISGGVVGIHQLVNQQSGPTAPAAPSAPSVTTVPTASALPSTRAVPATRASAVTTPSSTDATTSEAVPAEVTSFAGVRMVSARAGWAIAHDGLLYTTDAGESWSVRNPPGAEPAGLQAPVAAPPLSNAAFHGTEDAWIAAASAGTVTVFHTADAGAHWSSAAVHPNADAGMEATDTPMVLGLDFPTLSDGWLLTSAGGMGAGSEDVELYRTGDGGTTWTHIAAATQQQPSPTGLPDAGVKTGIGFTGPQQGWVTGYRGSQAGIWLYETGDAGHTWRATTPPTPPGVNAEATPQTFPPLFTSGGDGVLPVIWPGNVSTTVFYATADGGNTWRPTTPIKSADPMQIWSWPTATNGAAANDTTWCETDNAGQSWQCKPLPAALQGITNLDLFSPQSGWAIADGKLLRISDGGQTWSPIAPQLT